MHRDEYVLSYDVICHMYYYVLNTETLPHDLKQPAICDNLPHLQPTTHRRPRAEFFSYPQFFRPLSQPQPQLLTNPTLLKHGPAPPPAPLCV